MNNGNDTPVGYGQSVDTRCVPAELKQIAVHWMCGETIDALKINEFSFFFEIAFNDSSMRFPFSFVSKWAIAEPESLFRYWYLFLCFDFGFALFDQVWSVNSIKVIDLSVETDKLTVWKKRNNTRFTHHTPNGTYSVSVYLFIYLVCSRLWSDTGANVFQPNTYN